MDPNASTNKLFDQGRQLLAQGQGEEALHFLGLAHAQAPHHARIRSYYGLALAVVERRFAEAAELCNSSLKQEFFNPDLYHNAARVYLEFGFKADAIRCLRRGRMIDPSHAAISTLLRELGMRKGPVLRFLPRTHRLNVWLGHARHRLGSTRAASAH
jgi:Flp pilus assembly protein TadD